MSFAFIGVCVIGTTIIGLFFVHQENKREAEARKKQQSSEKSE